MYRTWKLFGKRPGARDVDVVAVVDAEEQATRVNSITTITIKDAICLPKLILFIFIS